MSARSYNRSGNGSFAQANGSSFARASFNFILLVIGAVIAVSIFAFSDVLLALGVVLSVLLLAAVIILRSLILRPHVLRPGMSAA